MNNSMMIRVAICDDHPIVRNGFAALVASQSDMSVIAEASTGREALAIARKRQCDVLLLDISMPDQNGVDTMRAIAQSDDAPKVLVLTGYPEKQYALNMLKLGAKGYLSKHCEPDELFRAIRTVATGRRHVSPVVGDLLASGLCANEPEAVSAPHLQLSDRELQVFLHLAKGATVSRIGELLNLSVKTISTYRSRVLEKLVLQSNSDLTYYAMKNGLID